MRLVLFLSLVLTYGCGKNNFKQLSLQGNGNKTVLLTGVNDFDSIKKQALDLGLAVQGETVLSISGPVNLLNEIKLENAVSHIEDSLLTHEKNAPFQVDSTSLYLAQKDFGLIEFWKKNPTADGRNVIASVIDDGISPHQSAFRFTTTGTRKLLMKGSNSTLTTFDLKSNDDGTFSGEIDETLKGVDGVQVDLNGDDDFTKFKTLVKDEIICLDLNLSDTFEDDECKGNFSKTGEYFLLPNTSQSITAEFNLETKKLKLSQPEINNDSHGEGVAAVLAGYNQANLGMNGVAPGAQLLDYDLSEISASEQEAQYTLGKFIRAIEWSAQNGAEVINISYSLFFTSVEAQIFMSQALDQLVKKHNLVLSFSGGNNGPGLGSLNRQLIYPPNVIVAGAYVSQELDARVWGTSGLPDEGRMIYYSSRGPSPVGGGGPNMIGPLSSLVHSTPEAGFRAFSGTSSAAPSVADLAAVLISALKLERIPINAQTIVHALRLSGKRLKNEPFVAQGYGLPQIEKAIEIYKKMITGESVININIQTNQARVDRQRAQGLVYFTSQSESEQSAQITLSATLSPLAPISRQAETLIPLTIEYSKGISGTKELWISPSSSRFFIDVKLDEMLENNAREALGEIKLRHSLTKELLAIIPVTVINDLSANKRMREIFTIETQGSERLHLNVSSGIQAVRIRARGIRGPWQRVLISTYSPHRIRTQSLILTDEIWLPIEEIGHYQIGLAMGGGSTISAQVELEVEPMSFKILQEITNASKPQVNVNYEGLSSVFARLTLQLAPERIARVLSTQGVEIEALEHTFEVSTPGKFSASLRSTRRNDLSFLYPFCTTKVQQNGESAITFDATYEHTSDQTALVTFRCIPFDHGMDSDHTEKWVLDIFKERGEKETKDLIIGPQSIGEIDFSKKLPGRYEIILNPMIGDQMINLGFIDLN